MKLINSFYFLQPVSNTNSHFNHYLFIVGQWIGRVVSTCFQISLYLSQLASKVQTVSKPIIHQVKSPNQTKESPQEIFEIEQDEIFKEIDEKAESVLKSFFDDLGFDTDIRNIFLKAVFLDINGKKLDPVELNNLNGEYLVKWKLNEQKEPSILLFQGHFKDGVLHGQGTFSKQESNGTKNILLEGHFNHGAFISGIAVFNYSYIVGSFKNGYNDGKGTIHYFETNTTAHSITHMEYHGEYINGIPNGKGEAFKVESKTGSGNHAHLALNRLKLIAEGQFKEGILVKGTHYDENGQIFKGKWEKNLFNGSVSHPTEEWDYEGTCLDGKFEGQGQLKTHQSHKYFVVESQDPPNQSRRLSSGPLSQRNGFVDCISTGEFKSGKLYEGQQSIQWSEGKTGIRIVENGKNTKTEIKTEEGLLYVGSFDSFLLDGHGKVSDNQGQEIYSGELKRGVPHGAGRLIVNGTDIYEGTFEWGQPVIE